MMILGFCSRAKGALPSATAIAGEGDHPAKQGGGGGAGLHATQASQINFGTTDCSSTTTKRRVRAPSTTVRSLRELQWSPSPAIAGAESAPLASPFAVSIHCKKTRKLRRRSADRRRGVLSEPRERMLPLARASGPARAEAQRARLSAFRRGTCGGERTPPLNSSPRFLGPGVIGCYPHLACPFSPASCLAVPVVVPDGRIRRSRPGAR